MKEKRDGDSDKGSAKPAKKKAAKIAAPSPASCQDLAAGQDAKRLATIRGATTLREIAGARPRPHAAVQAAMRALIATALYASGYHAFAHVLYVLAVIALVTSIEVQIASSIAQGIRRLWHARKPEKAPKIKEARIKEQ